MSLVNIERGMTFQEFCAAYPDEDACRERLAAQRWPGGFACPKCGSKRHCAVKRRDLFQCLACGRQTSATAGTAMHRSHLPLRTWFWAAFIVATDKRGSSAAYLARALGLRYKSAWLMLQKIKVAMGERDSRYQLFGDVELDDAYFGGPTKGKRGRGTGKAKVVAALSKSAEGKPAFIKLSVVPNLRGATVGAFAREKIREGASIQTDGLSGYRKPLAGKYNHNWAVYDSASGALAWLHTIISNAKSFVLGTFHGLGPLHLQRYLDEFCWRFNRRHRQGKIFHDLLRTMAFATPATYSGLKG